VGDTRAIQNPESTAGPAGPSTSHSESFSGEQPTTDADLDALRLTVGDDLSTSQSESIPGEQPTTDADLDALRFTIGDDTVSLNQHDDDFMAFTPTELMSHDNELESIDPVLRAVAPATMTPTMTVTTHTSMPFSAQAVAGTALSPAVIMVSGFNFPIDPGPVISPVSHDHEMPLDQPVLQTSASTTSLTTVSIGDTTTPLHDAPPASLTPATPKPTKRRRAKKPSPVRENFDSGSRRTRKPVASKEVIPLTDSAARESTSPVHENFDSGSR